MSLVAITLNGILRGENDSVIPSGRLLYEGLSATARLAVLVDSPDIERADYFLKTNGFPDYMYLLPTNPMDGTTPVEQRAGQLRYLRINAGHIDFVVEPDPSIAAALMRESYPVMLLMHPSFSRPQFRPDYKNEAIPWNDLTQELEHQKSLLANRTINDEPI